MVEMPSSVLSKITTHTVPGFSLLHGGFCDVEVVVSPTIVNTASVFKLATATRELIAGGSTQVYIESSGVKNLVSLAYLSLNVAAGPKLAIMSDDGKGNKKIVWEPIVSVFPYKPTETFLAMTVMGLNQAVVVGGVFVR